MNVAMLSMTRGIAHRKRLPITMVALRMEGMLEPQWRESKRFLTTWKAEPS